MIFYSLGQHRIYDIEIFYKFYDNVVELWIYEVTHLFQSNIIKEVFNMILFLYTNERIEEFNMIKRWIKIDDYNNKRLHKLFKSRGEKENEVNRILTKAYFEEQRAMDNEKKYIEEKSKKDEKQIGNIKKDV